MMCESEGIFTKEGINCLSYMVSLCFCLLDDKDTVFMMDMMGAGERYLNEVGWGSFRLKCMSKLKGK